METWLTWSEAAAVLRIPEHELATWAAGMGWTTSPAGVLVQLGAVELPRLRQLVDEQRRRRRAA